MANIHNQMFKFYSDHVKLGNSEKETLRDHRDKNKERLIDGLEKLSFPKPKKFITQGSYAMNTMTQYDSEEYDIDGCCHF